MLISLNWIKNYVDLPKDLDAKDLGLKLTMATVEVEEVNFLADFLQNVVVGKVVKLAKHPNADKLQLVSVNIGKAKPEFGEEIKVVCGGTNLQENMLVAVALPGAKVRWHGEGDLVELKVTKVRGEESVGMICASTEIGLENLFPVKQETEILDLSAIDAEVGQNLAVVFGFDDVVYDIDNKSLTNRPDLWGHYGMAREVAAIYNQKLKELDLKKIKFNKEIDLSVKVENKIKCPRYMAVGLKNIKITESPDWLKKQLQAIGQKSINNIVDVTNYVMYELGQPLHAFSADKIDNFEIIVRDAKPKEKIVTLDGETRQLTEDDLVIADNNKAIAVAGVMGNQNSEITDETNIVILESANFEPVTIRKTAGNLDLRTEAAMRFEKCLDPNLAETALKRAVNLIQEILPEVEVVTELIDESNFKLDQGPIEITWDFINERIGQDLGKDKIKLILENLGFELKIVKNSLKIKIPTWRATKDVSIKEDIIEEIARIFGYDNLEPMMPMVDMKLAPENHLRNLERDIKRRLAGEAGANEVLNYSFADTDLLLKIGQPIDHIELLNPWSENNRYMRKSLIPGLIQNVINNKRYFENINIFEVGKVFLPDLAGAEVKPNSKIFLPKQILMTSGAVSLADNNEDNFLFVKGQVEVVLNKLNLDFNYEVSRVNDVWTHPKQTLVIMVGKEAIGYISNLHPKIINDLDINSEVCVWQIDLEKLLSFYPTVKKVSKLVKFPPVELDLSILVDEKVYWKDIQSLIKAVDNNLIKRVELFDVYKSDKIEVGKKSLAFTITYQSDDKTLQMDEVQKLQEKVIHQLEKALNAEIRK